MFNVTQKKVASLMLVAVMLAGFAAIAQAALTADEILDSMEEESDRLAEGSLISIVRFDNAHADGTTTSNLFGGLSEPGKSLICFMEPEDWKGTLFLSVESGNEDENARLWLYLPLLGIPKELVSEEDRGGSFAGSSLSYEDLGGDDVRKDYNAELIGEETLTIGEFTRTAYVVELAAKPDADVDIVRSVIWLDTEHFTTLKSERYNDLGNLEQTMDVLMLGEFEGRLIADQIIARDVLEGSSTTISFLDRRRPDGEIPDSVFDPDNLASFDPSSWGFEG